MKLYVVCDTTPTQGYTLYTIGLAGLKRNELLCQFQCVLKKKAVKIKYAEGGLGCGRDDIKGRWNRGLVLAPRAADHLAVEC